MTIYIILFFSTLTILFMTTAIMLYITGEKTKITNKENPDFIDAFIIKKKEKLERTPGAIKIKTYVILMVIFSILFAVLTGMLTKNVWISPIGFILGLFVPEVIVKIGNSNYKKNFDIRYSRALRHLSSSLRAGLTLQQAVSDLCKSPFISHDIKKEFAMIDADIKIGISVSEAFANMAKRVPTEDVKDVATAVKMQSMVGGDEAQTIEYISNSISSRIMVRKEIKTLFSGTNVTIIGMELMPVAILGIMFLTTPSFFDPLFKSTFGMIIAGTAVIVMIIGSFVIRKLANKAKQV